MRQSASDSMIGLRGGEAPSPNSKRRKDEQGLRLARFLRGNGGGLDVFDVPLKVVATGFSSFPSSEPVLEEPSVPTDQPLRIAKTRKARQLESISSCESDQRSDPMNARDATTPLHTEYSRRGLSFPRLKLRKKSSTQDFVAAVREAYHSRPSFNLSRTRISIDATNIPMMGANGSSQHLGLQPCSSLVSVDGHSLVGNLTAENSHPNAQRKYGIIRKLSSKRKRILRPERRSHSLDASMPRSVRQRLSISAEAHNTQCSLKTSDGDIHDDCEACRNPSSDRLVAAGSQSAVLIRTISELRELDVAATARFWISVQVDHVVSANPRQEIESAPVSLVVVVDNT